MPRSVNAMHIGLVCPEYPPGLSANGVSTYTALLAEELASRWGVQGYAVAKVLRCLGLLLLFLRFTWKLGHKTIGELVAHLRVPFATAAVLVGTGFVPGDDVVSLVSLIGSVFGS